MQQLDWAPNSYYRLRDSRLAARIAAVDPALRSVIEVNPEATPFSESIDYCLRGPAGEILPQIAE